MRLIDKDALLNIFSRYYGNDKIEVDEVIEWIDEQPTIEERKTGKWHQRFYPKVEMMVCSECGNEFSHDAETGVRDYNFCPNCGADMRGDHHETP